VSMSSASSCSLPGLRPDRMLLLGQPMRLKYLQQQIQTVHAHVSTVPAHRIGF
jgi:hypothetical protein